MKATCGHAVCERSPALAADCAKATRRARRLLGLQRFGIVHETSDVVEEFFGEPIVRQIPWESPAPTALIPACNKAWMEHVEVAGDEALETGRGVILYDVAPSGRIDRFSLVLVHTDPYALAVRSTSLLPGVWVYGYGCPYAHGIPIRLIERVADALEAVGFNVEADVEPRGAERVERLLGQLGGPP